MNHTPLSRRTALRAATGAALMPVLAPMLGGCTSYYDNLYGTSVAQTLSLAQARPTDLVRVNHAAIDALLSRAVLDSRGALLVGTLVQVDRLYESSRLGRVFSEQLAGRLVQRGYSVAELKLRDRLWMRSGVGELMLSREVEEVSRSHEAQAVLVGTYGSSGQTLYVSLKLVRPYGGATPNEIVAAHDYALPVDANVRGLLLAV